MNRTANRRQNKHLRRIEMLKYEGEYALRKYIGELLEQWQKQACYRARHFFYRNGDPVPAVWDLFKRKSKIAAELGIKEELTEICRQAIAGELGSAKVGSSKIFV